jgi:hypothetical protein
MATASSNRSFLLLLGLLLLLGFGAVGLIYGIVNRAVESVVFMAGVMAIGAWELGGWFGLRAPGWLGTTEFKIVGLIAIVIAVLLARALA